MILSTTIKALHYKHIMDNSYIFYNITNRSICDEKYLNS